MQKKIILGSSSSYRKALLTRLNLSFECLSPNIDESPLEQESALEMVERLTIEKAMAVNNEQRKHNNASNSIIITSDQVAVLNDRILGKPITKENAFTQLTSFSGEKVSFLTGLCVFNQLNESYTYTLSQYHVYFRDLKSNEIKRYIEIEQPLDCAGSFKCEGLGVCLFEKMEGDDPTSLIGLPLISLCHLLKEQGINPID